MENLTINGVEFTPVKKGEKNRVVIVVDRGWIFAGDVTESNGRILLTRAVWVFRWESIGFAKVLEDPKHSKIDIRPISNVDIPVGSEVFRIPVSDDWGL